MNKYVYAIGVYDDQLFAAGSFTTAGGIDVNNIARWDGNEWYAMGSGFDKFAYGSMSPSFAMTSYKGELIIAGSFTVAGGNVSAYWTKWSAPDVYIGDLNHDCQLDFYDIDLFVEQWLKRDCEATGFCYEADMDYSRSVDFVDYAKLADSLGVLNSVYIADLNDDKEVNFEDFSILAGSWGTQENGPGWDPNCNLYQDDKIDLSDLQIFLDNWLAGI